MLKVSHALTWSTCKLQSFESSAKSTIPKFLTTKSTKNQGPSLYKLTKPLFQNSWKLKKWEFYRIFIFSFLLKRSSSARNLEIPLIFIQLSSAMLTTEKIFGPKSMRKKRRIWMSKGFIVGNSSFQFTNLYPPGNYIISLPRLHYFWRWFYFFKGGICYHGGNGTMENDACFNITPHSLLLLSTQTKLGVAVFPTLSHKVHEGWDLGL